MADDVKTGEATTGGAAPAAAPATTPDTAAATDTAATGKPAAATDAAGNGPAKIDAAAAKPTASAPAAEAAAAAEAVPDYGALELPEGYRADDPLLAEATSLFAEARLPPAAAQKLVDLVARRDRAIAEASARTWGDTIGRWQGELKASLAGSREFTGAGFGGDRLREVQALAAKAIDAYGGEDAPAIREHMKTYALGDFAPMARFMARAGRTVREDPLVRPDGAAGGTRTARQLYSSSNMNE